MMIFNQMMIVIDEYKKKTANEDITIAFQNIWKDVMAEILKLMDPVGYVLLYIVCIYLYFHRFWRNL